MSKIRGDLNPPKFRESRGLWFATLDLGRGPDGKRRKVEVSSKTRAGCIQKRMERIREIEDGTYTPGVKPTVSSWMDHWCDEIASDRVAPRTLANYRSYTRKHITPHVGARRLDALSVDDVRELHRGMRESGVSDRVVQAVHNTLSKALKDATREGVIAQNVCDRMDRPRARMQERGSYSRAEVRAILTTAEGDGPGEYSRWMAALTLGSRQGELLAFEWSRLDLTGGMADLSWQVQQLPWRHGHGCSCGLDVAARQCRHKEPDAPAWFELRPAHKGRWFTRPKTRASVRALPLPGPLVDVLRKWREIAPETSLGLVWPDSRGLPRTDRMDRAAWTDLCKRAGVRQLTLHSARHTMVSLLLDDGVDPEVIRQIAGHSTILSTRGYMHVSADRARDALARLAG
ncbi:tyrosine-type recombinase/integrase [Corynebacterium sp. USCH3]|uniref:tyrosine-type recombinase/integrase n=1 Tax=Corynebacterium sp. USCH3 TaxID=3024840 RepID=UPI0030B78687